MRKTVAIHYHSPYLYQCAIDSARASMGIASVTSSVIAVESLLGDIRLTYATRRDLIAEMEQPRGKIGFLSKQSQGPSASVDALRLTPQELTALQILEPRVSVKGNLNRKPALNLFYQLMGCARDENRQAGTYTRYNQRELLPASIVDLFELRHSIVHRDGTANVASDIEAVSQDGLPKSVVRLKEIGLLEPSQMGGGLGWLSAIDNRTVGEWSVSVAGEFIQLVLTSLPEGAASDYLRRNALP